MVARFGRLAQVTALAVALFSGPAHAQNLLVKGTTTSEGNAEFHSDVTVLGSITSVGNASVGSASVQGNATVGQNATVNGTATVQALDVKQTTTAEGNATFRQNVTVNGSIAVAGRDVSEGLLPTGTVIPFAGTTAPAGYILCDGRSVSRATYTVLWGVLGTRFGAGDGTTTFNVPDLRGEFVRGWDNGRGVDTGRALGSKQSDDFKSHTHDVQTDAADTINDGGHIDSSDDYRHGAGLIAYGHALARGGAETRPRNVALNYIIKF